MVFGSWTQIQNVKLQLYMCIRGYFFRHFQFVSNFISNRFGTISFFLPFSAFAPCMDCKKKSVFCYKSDRFTIDFIFFTPLRWCAPCACIIFAFCIFILGLLANKNRKGKKTNGIIMQSITTILCQNKKRDWKRGAQNETKAKTYRLCSC